MTLPDVHAHRAKMQLQICRVFGVHPYLLGYAPRPRLGRLALWWFDFRWRRLSHRKATRS